MQGANDCVFRIRHCRKHNDREIKREWERANQISIIFANASGGEFALSGSGKARGDCIPSHSSGCVRATWRHELDTWHRSIGESLWSGIRLSGRV